MSKVNRICRKMTYHELELVKAKLGKLLVTARITERSKQGVRAKYHFLVRRVHSLAGVLPIGIFLIFHLNLNVIASVNPALYERYITVMRNLPWILYLETLLVFLPLFFHAVYGLIIAYDAEFNLHYYLYSRNWYFMLQRLSGILTFLFVVLHLTLVTAERGSAADTVQALTGYVAARGGQILFLIGVLAAVFHFANGLWAFLITWGITVGPRSQRVAGWLCGGVFVLLSVTAVQTIAQLRGGEF